MSGRRSRRAASGAPTKKKPKTKLPDSAVKILREWLFSPEHVDYPYPSPKDKEELLRKTGISSKQLQNWLTNSRKRLWQPLRKQQQREIVPYNKARAAKRFEEYQKMSLQGGDELGPEAAAVGASAGAVAAVPPPAPAPIPVTQMATIGSPSDGVDGLAMLAQAGGGHAPMLEVRRQHAVAAPAAPAAGSSAAPAAADPVSTGFGKGSSMAAAASAAGGGPAMASLQAACIVPPSLPAEPLPGQQGGANGTPATSAAILEGLRADYARAMANGQQLGDSLRSMMGGGQMSEFAHRRMRDVMSELDCSMAQLQQFKEQLNRQYRAIAQARQTIVDANSDAAAQSALAMLSSVVTEGAEAAARHRAASGGSAAPAASAASRPVVGGGGMHMGVSGGMHMGGGGVGLDSASRPGVGERRGSEQLSDGVAGYDMFAGVGQKRRDPPPGPDSFS